MRRCAGVVAACAGMALVSAAGATAAPAAPSFDPGDPPAAIGETLAQVLARWGERATFGADCGSWRGASVDLDVIWEGAALRVMALLQGNRVAALRFERTLKESGSLAQCEAQLDAFQSRWTAAGIESRKSSGTVYDGPVMRVVHPASRDGRPVGGFEGDYRASRAVCTVALVINRP